MMKCDTEKTAAEFAEGNIRSNTECGHYPCHFRGQNCSFCYCPFYPCLDGRLGKTVRSESMGEVWSCADCTFIHRGEVVEHILSAVRRDGMMPGDPRLREVFEDCVSRFWNPGKAVMVLGATSDAGKSVTVAALGRIMMRRGYICTPFKSQNMSLNSRVTPRGDEISMVQMLQAEAMGLKDPDFHMNPILLKPKGNAVSQVIVEGKPFGDYDVSEYYGEFVQGIGKDIVRRNVEFLRNRYDYVIMEGAGSPAEINIYDRDIANMRAAEIADAVCILVVNVEWGGSFAYAVGTVELLAPEDRRRIKGIILNNVRGDPETLRSGAKELESRCGIPVIGIIPHADIELPKEDSESLRGLKEKGDGRMRIAVVRFPRISNFTDLDPLYAEDTTVVFADSPEDVLSADAVILPGTKNTVDDYLWMKETGIAEAVLSMKGKIPILGICGGYQMMGAELCDPNGIEGAMPGTYEGLGLFNNTSYWDEYGKTVVRDSAEMIDGGGKVEGYEIHMGKSVVREQPLFRIESVGCKERVEGSVRESEMLYGTYMHGVLDKPAFRKRFLSRICSERSTASVSPRCADKDADTPLSGDYAEYVDRNLDLLADVFESGLNMPALLRIMGAGE